MYQNKKILAVIPARGGSKRLPNKNIKELNGKPLINWTIDAALKSNYLTEVIVSTDSQDIANIAIKAGGNVPFLRPENLAKDNSTTYDTIEHAVLYYKNELGQNFDYVILLQPTSPLRDSKDIDQSIEMLFEKKSDAIISVCEAEHSPLWSNTLNINNDMSNFIASEIKNKRSQDLDTFYRINGAIYICDTTRLLQEKVFFLESNIYAYIMPVEHSIDIDNIIDFKLAEVIVNENQ